MKIIGAKEEGISYTPRRCSYVIIEAEDKIVLANAEDKYYIMLGGGIEDDDYLEGLKREVIEEAGYTMKNIKLFDQIRSYINSSSKGYIEIIANFYIASFDEKVAEPIELDHTLVYAELTEYQGRLHREFQNYILDNYIKSKMPS